MELTNVIKIWDELHVKDTGELGYCDLEAAIEQVIGIENDVPLREANKRIAELEAIIIEADAQFNIGKQPMDIESASLALCTMCSMGREAMDKVGWKNLRRSRRK